MKKNIIFSLVLSVILLLQSLKAFSQIDIDIETGVINSGYNDVRIPGDKGTLFSLSEELDADPGIFYRIRIIYNFNNRHHFGGLFAPLSIQSTGQLYRDLFFNGETFPAKSPLKTTYMFNSYRVFYRYDFLRKEKINMGIGFTAKIRDAKIAVKGNGLETEKTNIGFVPIIHFRLLLKFTNKFALWVDGDALAAPQGRAEDVLTALIFNISDKIDIKAGYRILEGGADNDTVYNFALIHYASVGAILHF